MGSLRLTLCAGAVVAVASTVTAPSAPSAHAADSGDISVVPASPAPGSDIQVRAKGCGGKSGSAASKAFVADAQLTRLTRLIRLTGQGVGTLSGDTRVRSSLEPGTYDVSVTCDGKEHKARGTITVGENGKPAATEPGPPKPDATKPDATKPEAAEPAASARPSAPASPASPVAPARAGGGGAADQVATSQGAADPVDSMDDARHTGPGARHAVVGLVLAGVAAVVVVARGVRRSRRRGTE